MAIRVTQSMLNNQLLRNVSSNLNKMNTLQNQLSTGKKINAPSDDPVGLTFAMRYRNELSSNSQYISNVDSALSFINYTDTALGQIGDVAQRARELMVQGSNTQPDTAYSAIRLELSELYNQLAEIGNSKFNGKYAFNGEQTTAQPYPKLSMDDTSTEAKAYEVTTDLGQVRLELSPSMTLAVNVPGSEIFGEAVTPANETDNDNLFYVLKQACDALDSGRPEQVSGLLAKLDSRINTILEKRSEIGARMNRVELIQGRLGDIEQNLTELQSKTEDADMAYVITNLQMEENVYQASLSTGARLIQPSLIDFLR
ncbi:flagellar hook-associated protein FlgL [Paenibacillus sp. GCM10012307]|uniref:Flagellar hook-associated protein FlgL n=1 Tax=Paenibacillus roseus TaxID=2798579 RepID=A0A934MQI7_9BACL|nr:flagellar hook-associated protein FlgL [Paenibacillus roseus]MBJ6361928.1 flagellar hook-associated protein FlgL [Paenibacillus roseus]